MLVAINLFEHNRKAYEASTAMLAQTGKAAIIHPTGTGKSFIGFKLCEDNPNKRILWLSPSEYIFRTQLENLAATGNKVPKNIIFLTYAKLLLLSDDEIRGLQPDMEIFDEYHRAGAACWGQGIARLRQLFPDAPMLGLSATNIRYLDNQRDMAEELFDGCIASEMTLGEAIVRGILNSPRYILSIYSYQKDLEKYEKRVRSTKNKAVRAEAAMGLEALRRALEHAEGLDVIFDRHMTDRHGKYIIFTPNYEVMQEYIALASDWFGKIDREMHIYSVYSDDPSASKSFRDFKADFSDHLRLLYCIDALNEGVHVEGISGVILLRPTISPIIYKQQIGRALSASKSHEPVIFDVVNNIENLYSIDAVREEMQAAITYYHYIGENRVVVNDNFTILDETADYKRLFEKLEGTLTAGWDLMYEKAREYYNIHGNLMIPAKYITEDGCALGNWLNIQRKAYVGKTDKQLSIEQIEKLEQIGIVWNSRLDLIWDLYYAAATRYFEKNGDLKIPNDYVTPDGLKLGIWIQRMRSAKAEERGGVLTAEREAKLTEIGMVWNMLSEQWEANYFTALQYFNAHGDLDVPLRYVAENGIKLGNWIAHLRQRKFGKGKGSPLTCEQIMRLEQIGMIWDPEQHRFEIGMRHARNFYEQRGHLRVPAAYCCEDGFALGRWIRLKRRQFERGSLPIENVRSLEAIGMIWDVFSEVWLEMYLQAKAYYDHNGNLEVPRNYVAENGKRLDSWIYKMRRKRASLSDEQIRMLDAIGFR